MEPHAIYKVAVAWVMVLLGMAVILVVNWIAIT
jgi:hypothetical protein